MTEQDFEQRLVEAIQPIRYLALAQALLQLDESGIYELLASSPGVSVTSVANRLGLYEDRLTAYFQYLANEGYLVEDNGWRLTDKGRSLAPFFPWYTLLVGGYADTFGQLGDALREGSGWASRNGVKVASGSCGISAYDALPIATRLLSNVTTPAPVIVDLGCGDAGFLVALCRERSDVRGVGVEPDADAAQRAKQVVEREGMADRISIHQGTAADVLNLDLSTESPCFLTAFVLQEMLEQAGRDAIHELLQATFRRYPSAHWLVVEVDHRPADRKIMAHGLGLAYYNPYYLIHAITEQRLVSRNYWEDLFATAGVDVVAVQHPLVNVDSTDLEVGYLLCGARDCSRQG